MNRIEKMIAGKDPGTLWTQKQAREEISAALREVSQLRAKHGVEAPTSGELASLGQPRVGYEALVAKGGAGFPLLAKQSYLNGLSQLAADELRELRAKDTATKPAAPAAKPAAAAPTPKPAAVTKPAPAAVVKPVAPALTGTITAEQFRASVAKPTMTRAEFQKLTHPERNDYIRSGGKLTD